MSDFHYETLFQRGPDAATSFRHVTGDHVEVVELGGEQFLRVAPEALSLLANEAYNDLAHLLRPSHLQSLSGILRDDEASRNDRITARELLHRSAALNMLPAPEDQ